MSTETTENKPPKSRFVKGKLVMLSRKYNKSGNIPFFRKSEADKAPARGNKRGSRAGFGSPRLDEAGRLERGVPIFLMADPVFLEEGEVPNFASWYNRSRDKHFWKISFIYDEQLYVMFLTKRQYNHELVKAVPRRLTKDYGNGSSKVRT